MAMQVDVDLSEEYTGPKKDTMALNQSKLNIQVFFNIYHVTNIHAQKNISSYKKYRDRT